MRALVRVQPPSVTYAVGATSPVGAPGDVVWSTAAGQYLQWRGASWMVLPRLAVAADGAPPAIGASGGAGNTGYAADAGHWHAHGNQAGGALHALADVNNPGFLSSAQWTILQSLGLGVATSVGAADSGKVPKLNGAGRLDASILGRDVVVDGAKLDNIEAEANKTLVGNGPATAVHPLTPPMPLDGSGLVADAAHVHPISYASETQDGIMAAADFLDMHNMQLPPEGKLNRQWVPNSGATTYDDRGWGAAVWGTPTGQAVANAPATRFSRIRYATATTTNAGAGVSGALNVQRAAAVGVNIGGFKFTARFRIQQISTTNQWFFIGIYSGGTWTGATLPTAIANCMGFYLRANALTFLSVPTTVGSFTSTAISGVTPAQMQTSGVEVHITAPDGNNGPVAYGIRPIDTTTWFGGSVSGASLIASGIPLGPMCAMSASTTLQSVQAELGVMTLQSRY